jgi:SET domain-containing protein
LWKELKLPSFDQPTSKYQLRFGRSRIHSAGVFALEAIPRGKKVVEYTGD